MDRKEIKMSSENKWNCSLLKEWKIKYTNDVIWGEKNMSELEKYLHLTYSVHNVPLSNLDTYYLNDYLPNELKADDTEFKLFYLERNSVSEKYYQLESDNITIWVLLGNKGHLSSNSSLLYCELVQYKGLSLEDFESETEACYLYFANINSLYLQRKD